MLEQWVTLSDASARWLRDLAPAEPEVELEFESFHEMSFTWLRKFRLAAEPVMHAGDVLVAKVRSANDKAARPSFHIRRADGRIDPLHAFD